LNLLLDTHIAIWAVSDSARLGSQTASLLRAATPICHVSEVSLIEIAIKRAAGKASRPPFPTSTAKRLFEDAGLILVPIDPAALDLLEELRIAHQDPFDRLLIAEASTRAFRLVTRDRAIASMVPTALLG
jgi:PIN domain nuclease of toxin-antitoxin system